MKKLKDANVKVLEEQLCQHLGTRVEIWGENEGTIQIEFGSVTEFNRIFNAILEKESVSDDDE